MKTERTMLSNSEKIYEVLSEVYDLLAVSGQVGHSVIDGMNRALTRLGQISSFSESFSSHQSEIENMTYRMDDIIREIRRQLESFDFSPAKLDQVEKRLDLIQSLKRKYGKTVKDILNYRDQAQKQLDEMLGNEELVAGLSKEIQDLRREIYSISSGISLARKKAAEVLEDKIAAELEDLEMKGTLFKVSIETRISEPDHITAPPPENGYDKIEFLISINEGEPLKPLSKTASGGEMSRIMLALKKYLQMLMRFLPLFLMK